MTLERRAISQAPELRADGSGRTAAGYAALFNVAADIGGMFVEKIANGAFTESLARADVRALVDHDTGRVIGRSAAGTLKLREDAKGLFTEIDLPDTTDGRDLAVQIARGDITGMSFGFRVQSENWDESGDVPVRTILKADLIEVSAVAFPAYPETSIAMRSLEEARKEHRRKNFNAAAKRLRMKMTLGLKSRSKA